jgi:hypothetical protein
MIKYYFSRLTLSLLINIPLVAYATDSTSVQPTTVTPSPYTVLFLEKGRVNGLPNVLRPIVSTHAICPPSFTPMMIASPVQIHINTASDVLTDDLISYLEIEGCSINGSAYNITVHGASEAADAKHGNLPISFNWVVYCLIGSAGTYIPGNC